MRKVLIVFTFFILLITACSLEPAPTEEAPDSGDQPASTSVPGDSTEGPASLGPAEAAVVKQLTENLGLDESEISVMSSEEAEFGDACLDVSMEGVLCAQVVTPGRIIVLEANGVEYEYHTSEDGSLVQPATLAVVWKREGGIAGFCDTLTVFRSGEVFTNTCNAQAEGTMETLADLLTARETQQFSDWIGKFGEVTLDASDPKGVADQMIVTLEMFGNGTEEPTESEQQALFNFAQSLYQKAAK